MLVSLESGELGLISVVKGIQGNTGEAYMTLNVTRGLVSPRAQMMKVVDELDSFAVYKTARLVLERGNAWWTACHRHRSNGRTCKGRIISKLKKILLRHVNQTLRNEFILTPGNETFQNTGMFLGQHY